MSINFDPQFHKKVALAGQAAVWRALPHPKTVVRVKSMYYRQWQLEESRKLKAAGETVIDPSNLL